MLRDKLQEKLHRLTPAAELGSTFCNDCSEFFQSLQVAIQDCNVLHVCCSWQWITLSSAVREVAEKLHRGNTSFNNECILKLTGIAPIQGKKDCSCSALEKYFIFHGMCLVCVSSGKVQKAWLLYDLHKNFASKLGKSFDLCMTFQRDTVWRLREFICHRLCLECVWCRNLQNVSLSYDFWMTIVWIVWLSHDFSMTSVCLT